MTAKPKTHITDPRRPGVGGLVGTPCGLFVIPEQVNNRNPSCQKCLQFPHTRRGKAVSARQRAKRSGNAPGTAEGGPEPL